jgi:hypothetical protein
MSSTCPFGNLDLTVIVFCYPTLPRDQESWLQIDRSWNERDWVAFSSVPGLLPARERALSCEEMDQGKGMSYQPIIRWRKVSCFTLIRGLVNMSAQLRLLAILVMAMWPACNWSLKWCHFSLICFIQTFVPSLYARIMQEALSSYICAVSKLFVMVLLNGVLSKWSVD